MHRRLDLRWFVVLLAVMLTAACATRPETPRDRIAAAQLTLKTVYGTAADIKARGKLSPASEKKVLDTGAQAQAAIDVARSRLTGLGDDPKLLEQALLLMEARLLAMERAANEGAQ